jgi:ABC-type multidrug transport system ATPase subunit
VHSGQVRFRGKNVIELPINAQRKDVMQNVYFVGLESDLYGDNVSVERYCADLVGEADAPVLRDHLFRFNLIKKGFMKRKMSALTVSERARVMISCAMLTKKELVVLVDPQQWLDAPSRLTLKELLVEWKNSAPENTLLVLTSDEVILPKKRGKNG